MVKFYCCTEHSSIDGRGWKGTATGHNDIAFPRVRMLLTQLPDCDGEQVHSPGVPGRMFCQETGRR
jgi:hypothetical protein